MTSLLSIKKDAFLPGRHLILEYMKLMAAFWLLLIPQLVFSQARTVLDKHSNLPVAYATVKVLQQKKGPSLLNRAVLSWSLMKTTACWCRA